MSVKVEQITLQEPISIIVYFCFNTPNFQGPVGPVSQKILGPHEPWPLNLENQKTVIRK